MPTTELWRSCARFVLPSRSLLRGADDARAGTQAAGDRRERWVEARVAVAFVLCASAMAIGIEHDPREDLSWPPWFVGLACRAAADRVRSRRGTYAAGPARARADAPRPAAGDRPGALIAVANVLARLPEAVAARRGSITRSRPSPIADAWFAVGPALVLCVTGVPSGIGGKAVAARRGGGRPDRPRLGGGRGASEVGLGLAMREQLSAFAWVYLVDLLLTPVGAARRDRRRRDALGGRGGPAAGRTAHRLRARAPRADRERPRAASHGRAERGTTGVDRPELERPHRDPRARRRHSDAHRRDGRRLRCGAASRRRPAAA